MVSTATAQLFNTAQYSRKMREADREIRQGIAEFEAVLTAGFTQEERRELLRLLYKIEGNVDAASASDGRPARKGERLC